MQDQNQSIDRKKSAPLAKTCGILGILMIVIVLLLFLPMTVLPLFRVQLLDVVSGSMEPAIPVHSLVCITGAIGEEIQEGDVITYSGGGLNQNTVVTHRVLENRSDEGTVITQGDANTTPDPYPIAYEQIIGRVRWHVPVLGGVYSFFSTFIGKLTALGGILLGLCFLGLENYFQKK